ncbi:monothiol glutaredoxin-S7, chloroplastic isoform X2 [Salvia miltiorrhiza]|uniref:monothiol glutaredoxin-S7, chloroplastic isoform X2 n=1 Tax=Salvia miltiorrhiza TaxID=226208 RepID=UPI0025AB70E9|nr:monothiol glutaredoxin-S7, chloroplastic isoform X2 [Salvia miltiorrhiza]
MSFHLQLAARPSSAAAVEAPAFTWGCRHRRPICINSTHLCSAAAISFPLKLSSRATNLTSNSSSSPFRCFSALSPELKSTLDKVVSSDKVVLFMKGTKDFPQCGFSHTVVQILKTLNVPFETINILENEILRQGLKEYSSWPTFPQLYIDGEFFGGCDITLEAYKSGELQEVLEKAMCS